MPSSRWTTSSSAYGSFHGGVQHGVSRSGVPFASSVNMATSRTTLGLAGFSALSGSGKSTGNPAGGTVPIVVPGQQSAAPGSRGAGGGMAHQPIAQPRVQGSRAAPAPTGPPAISKAELRQAFDDFDVDGSGYIGFEEVMAIEEAFDIPSAITSNMQDWGDGKITFDEFCNWLHQAGYPVQDQVRGAGGMGGGMGGGMDGGMGGGMDGGMGGGMWGQDTLLPDDDDALAELRGGFGGSQFMGDIEPPKRGSRGTPVPSKRGTPTRGTPTRGTPTRGTPTRGTPTATARGGGGGGGGGAIRGNRKPPHMKHPKMDRMQPRRIDWTRADPSRWTINQVEYNGGYSVVPGSEPKIMPVSGAIADGVRAVQDFPDKYMGIFYQTDMVDWPEDQQEYNLVSRCKGGFNVQAQPGGGFTWLKVDYQALPPEVNVKLDRATDQLSFQGRALGRPLCPGRGEGVADVPSLSIIGDVDPNDVNQGSIGDCWLLSGMSALAEFAGAVKALFKKTPGIERMPGDGGNSYTVTLYDLSTWQPVDITIDERLCGKVDGSGLLGCSPSITGDLWACYLEKACAIHCGGWDKLQGGQCTHAWRLLTGCKEQYTFMNLDGSGFSCLGAKNPNTGQWEQLANSPHDGFQGLWPMEWPEVGGGGDMRLKVSEEDFFERMCEWDDQNYIMGCGTKSGSDTNTTDGIVDGHAYTILTCVNNAGGTEFDLIKVRNPWGSGEFKSGRWDDDGPGWDQYPQVKAAINPVLNNDDGVFWVEKDEFFKYFKTIYLCAKDMSAFIEA